jgi:hypothetical protein
MTPINGIKLLRLTTCLWSPCGKLRGYTKALGAWQTRIPLNDIAEKNFSFLSGPPTRQTISLQRWRKNRPPRPGMRMHSYEPGRHT